MLVVRRRRSAITRWSTSAIRRSAAIESTTPAESRTTTAPAAPAASATELTSATDFRGETIALTGIENRRERGLHRVEPGAHPLVGVAERLLVHFGDVLQRGLD